MRRYSFIYSGSNKRITELIEHLEEVYKLKFLDVIDNYDQVLGDRNLK